MRVGELRDLNKPNSPAKPDNRKSHFKDTHPILNF